MSKAKDLVTVAVTFELPNGMSAEQASGYVRDAILEQESRGGEPYCDVKMETLEVKVSSYRGAHGSFDRIVVQAVPKETVAVEDVSFALKARNGQVVLLDVVPAEGEEEFELRLGHFD